MEKAHRFPAAQNEAGGRRTGQGEGQLFQSFVLFHVAGIAPAGAAEGFPAASLQIKVTEIFLVQESAAAFIPAEALAFPVYFVLQTAAQRPGHMAVFFQGTAVDLNLPAGAAGVRTGAADTVKG